VFNPPFYRGAPLDPLDQAWRSVDVIERFGSGLGQALSPTGEARIVLSTDGDSPGMLRALTSAGLLVREVVARDFGNEVLTVYAATPA
jgi:hypothetical protein